MRVGFSVACALGLLLVSACGDSGHSASRAAGDQECAESACGPDGAPPAPLVCEGSDSTPCPAGYRCVDDLTDRCAPGDGSAECRGTCVLGEELPRCGGLVSMPCPEGHLCVDDATDGCDGGPPVDCPGVCRPRADGQCATDADCPQSAVPCSVCADGAVSCPAAHCDRGECRADFKPCPEPPPPNSCGGIAGTPCPAGLVCVDDPNDTCDPHGGGADCPGTCEPDGADECETNGDCPAVRGPCRVCADGTEECPRSSCDSGRCNLSFPSCVTPPVVCGSDGSGCEPGATCVDNPSDGCGPAVGGISCPGVCQPPVPPQCDTDDDCVAIGAPCNLCPNGAYACPRSQCRAGTCAVLFDVCSDTKQCGGIAGVPCATGFTCVDDPADDCDPQHGGADCGGLCVREEEVPRCGGITGAPCPDGYECLDDPRDDCGGDTGADCPGICRPAPSPKCAGDVVCPEIGAPCVLCADGTAACPRSFCQDGVCYGEFPTCGGE